jgi:photosystem I reaction center subunit VIII
MIAPYFPSILVPIVGIFLPGVAMAALFIFIEKNKKINKNKYYAISYQSKMYFL